MKPNILNIVGVMLILFGIITLGYHGFTYTKQEKVAELGPLKVFNETEKPVTIPPLLSGLALVAGIILVVVGSKSK
jgi:hypothetical protein